jgi:hypothetical protein
MSEQSSKGKWFLVERASWIAVILGIGFAAFGIVSWWLDQNARRQAELESNTLEFVKKYQDPHMLGQRFALLEPWLQYDVKELVEVEAISERAVTDTVFNMIDLSAGRGPYHDMRLAIFDIVDFYETLVVCIEVKRCNGEVANSYFKEYANQFYCLYKPYILKLRLHRELPSNYACRLARFAGECETAPTKSGASTQAVQSATPRAANSSDASNDNHDVGCPL